MASDWLDITHLPYSTPDHPPPPTTTNNNKEADEGAFIEMGTFSGDQELYKFKGAHTVDADTWLAVQPLDDDDAIEDASWYYTTPDIDVKINNPLPWRQNQQQKNKEESITASTVQVTTIEWGSTSGGTGSGDSSSEIPPFPSEDVWQGLHSLEELQKKVGGVGSLSVLYEQVVDTVTVGNPQVLGFTAGMERKRAKACALGVGECEEVKHLQIFFSISGMCID